MLFRKLQKETTDCPENTSNNLTWISLGIAALYGVAGSLFLLGKRAKRPSGRKVDIEIRYFTEKNADTTFLAQNLVKIISMVLTPLESKISKEEAGLIFVYGDDGWEMRVRNGSEGLRCSVRKLLEAKEW